MVPQYTGQFVELAEALPLEWQRLVRLCARLTGDRDVAEDLAQETMVEAWRNAHKLVDPAGYAPWLSAIARNICLRWVRQHGRTLTFQAWQGDDDPADLVADEFDLEHELDRSELADLLDRALALLPPSTRALLIERFVLETPVGELAERLRLSEAAVTMRLQRGKLLLRRVLQTDLKDDAASFGLSSETDASHQETRIWCPLCGQARLRGAFEQGTRQLKLTCPVCMPTPHNYLVNGGSARMFKGVRGFRPALSRLVAWGHAYFDRGLVEQVVTCINCGSRAPIRLWTAPEGSPGPVRHGVAARCPTCHQENISALFGLALCLPEAQGFWRAHARMRTLPEQEVEVVGRAAILTRFEDVTGSAQFGAVFAADSFRILDLFGAPTDARRR